MSLLDPETGEALYEVRGATPTPDRSALLTTESTAGKTLLQSRDPVTGAVTGTTTLDGDLTVRTVSPKGGAVALMPGPKGVGLYEAGLARAHPPHRLLPRRPAAAHLRPPGQRRAGDVLLGRGRAVRPPVRAAAGPDRLRRPPPRPRDGRGRRTPSRRRSSSTRAMRGRARAQVLAPAGRPSCSRSTRVPNDGQPGVRRRGRRGLAPLHVHPRHQPRGGVVVLHLPPDPDGHGRRGRGRPRASPRTGASSSWPTPARPRVARIDTAELEVTRTASDRGPPRRTATRRPSPSPTTARSYLTAGATIFEMDLATLQLSAAWAVDGHRSPASASRRRGASCGWRTAGVITLVDRATRARPGCSRRPGRGSVSLLGPPRGTVTEFPLECAC